MPCEDRSQNVTVLPACSMRVLRSLTTVSKCCLWVPRGAYLSVIGSYIPTSVERPTCVSTIRHSIIYHYILWNAIRQYQSLDSGDFIKIQSLSIRLDDDESCTQVLIGDSAIYLHGSAEAVHEFGIKILKELTHRKSPMLLLKAIKREDLDGFNGNVFYAVGDVTFYGFLNDSNEFVELFAESVFGRSHRQCGRVHPAPLESLSICTLERRYL